jgi:hypothetical protein
MRIRKVDGTPENQGSGRGKHSFFVCYTLLE